MFSKKVKTLTTIELDDETKQSLVSLDNDIQVLQQLMNEVLQTSRGILAALHGEIIKAVPSSDDEEGVVVEGVAVFEGEHPDFPEEMAENKEMTHRIPDEDRVRSTPFTRAPRNVQVKWLMDDILKDKQWYAPIQIAREHATDERHFRYMRGAITGRLREMWEEGLVERRDSHVKGSMFEYRRKK